MSWGRKERTEDGAFRFDRQLSDLIWLGTELETKQRVVLTKLVTTDLTLDELRAKLEYQIEGVASLRAIVAASDQHAPHGAICVEALPEGELLADKPVMPDRRIWVARQLAAIVMRAADRGIALVGLRPDLVAIGDVVTVAPRWVRFLGFRSKRFKYIEESFTKPSPSQRFVDLTLGAAEDPRVDVYLLGLLISWLWTSEYALNADDRRAPWPGPPALDELIGAMLSRIPAQRPTIDIVVKTLDRA